MSLYDFFYYDPKKWNKLSDKMLIQKKEKQSYHNINNAFNSSIKNMKRKSNLYKDKLFKLKNIRNYSRNPQNDIEVGKDFEF